MPRHPGSCKPGRGELAGRGPGPIAAAMSTPRPNRSPRRAGQETGFVAGILERVVRRTAKVLVGFDEEVESEADAMAALQAAEVDRRSMPKARMGPAGDPKSV